VTRRAAAVGPTNNNNVFTTARATTTNINDEKTSWTKQKPDKLAAHPFECGMVFDALLVFLCPSSGARNEIPTKTMAGLDSVVRQNDKRRCTSTECALENDDGRAGRPGEHPQIGVATTRAAAAAGNDGASCERTLHTNSPLR